MVAGQRGVSAAMVAGVEWGVGWWEGLGMAMVTGPGWSGVAGVADGLSARLVPRVIVVGGGWGE